MTSAVTWLFGASVVVYFLQMAVTGRANMIAALGLDARAMPASLWTMVTYLFVHVGFLQLALNMLAISSFGPPIERRWGARAFVVFYLWCGIGGALTQLILVRGGILAGASSAVYGLLLAYAMTSRDAEVFVLGALPIRAKWLMLWLVAANVAFVALAAVRTSDVAVFAHLGGVVFGWLYLKSPGGGSMTRMRDRVSTVSDDAGEMPRVVPKAWPRERATDEAAAGRPMSAADKAVAQSRLLAESVESPPAHAAGDERAELDAVLDKISRSGLDSLTLSEKRILERLSQELRDR